MISKSDSFTLPYPLILILLTKHQHNLIKEHLVNMNNQFNEVFSSFDSLNPKFRPGNRIIDCFSNHFSNHLFNKNFNYLFKDQIHQLDNIAIESSSSPSTALMVTDTSVKNNVASSICTHIYL